MRVIILGFGGREEVVRESERLEPIIAEHAEIAAMDFTGEADLSEIDADYALRFEYVMDAITAVSGYVGPDNNIVKICEKIKFAPPRTPE